MFLCLLVLPMRVMMRRLKVMVRGGMMVGRCLVVVLGGRVFGVLRHGETPAGVDGLETWARRAQREESGTSSDASSDPENSGLFHSLEMVFSNWLRTRSRALSRARSSEQIVSDIKGFRCVSKEMVGIRWHPASTGRSAIGSTMPAPSDQPVRRGVFSLSQ